MLFAIESWETMHSLASCIIIANSLYSFCAILRLYLKNLCIGRKFKTGSARMPKSDFTRQRKSFFFNDPSIIAEHARKSFPKECERVIASADRAASGRFRFDLRWDMERTYDDEVFEDEIDWLRQPADDPEWVYAFNRMRFWITMGQAYALTGDEKYPKAFAKQLKS
jgi:hypothetical protein